MRLLVFIIKITTHKCVKANYFCCDLGSSASCPCFSSFCASWAFRLFLTVNLLIRQSESICWLMAGLEEYSHHNLTPHVILLYLKQNFISTLPALPLNCSWYLIPENLSHPRNWTTLLGRLFFLPSRPYCWQKRTTADKDQKQLLISIAPPNKAVLPFSL